MGFVGGGLAVQNPDKHGLYNGGSRLNSMTDYQTRVVNPYRIDGSAPLAPISNIMLRNVVDDPLGWQELSMMLMPTPGQPQIQRPLGLKNDVRKQMLHPGYHDQNSFIEKPKPSGKSFKPLLSSTPGNSIYTPPEEKDPFADENMIVDPKDLKRKRRESFVFGNKKKIAIDDAMETLSAGDYPSIPKPLSGLKDIPPLITEEQLASIVKLSPEMKKTIFKTKLESIVTPFKDESMSSGSYSPNKFITQDIGKRKRHESFIFGNKKKSRTDKGLLVDTSVPKATKKSGEKMTKQKVGSSIEKRIPVVRAQRSKK